MAHPRKSVGSNDPRLDLEPGNVRCLKCDRVFRSWDRRRNRLCPRCAVENSRLRLPKVYKPAPYDQRDDAAVFGPEID